MFGCGPSHVSHLSLVWIGHRPGPQQELLGLLRPLEDGWIPVLSISRCGQGEGRKVKGAARKQQQLWIEIRSIHGTLLEVHVVLAIGTVRRGLAGADETNTVRIWCNLVIWTPELGVRRQVRDRTGSRLHPLLHSMQYYLLGSPMH